MGGHGEPFTQTPPFRSLPGAGLEASSEETGRQRRAQPHLPALGRKDVTLRKLDIKVETVNREPLTMHSDREDDTASISTATRVMKTIYSVSGRSCGPIPKASFASFHISCRSSSVPATQLLCTNLLRSRHTLVWVYIRACTGMPVHTLPYMQSHVRRAALPSPPTPFASSFPHVEGNL